MCRRRAFTLIELLITAVIVGILSTLAVMTYGKSLEIAHGRDAEAVLRAIYTAERAFYFDQLPNAYGTLANLIPVYLPSDPSSAEWTYPVANTATTFTATATRQQGSQAGQTRTIDQSNVLNPATWP